jgi:two-component system response regulator PilR (NtrC family)
MQVKLLRVIQEKAVRAVGAQQEEAVDVRILSATHRDLAELVRAGRFREDLYYRINVIQLRVPALRERREDMDALIDAILHRLARKLPGPAPRLGDAARRALHAHAFPGNVRELENILERALALNAGDEIGVDDLQLRATPMAPLAPPTAGTGGEGLDDQLEHIERDAIVRALEQTRYNKTAAAQLLGMSFRALRYKVKKLGIE